MKNQKPFFSVLLSGILWGLITVFIKNLSALGVDALEISLLRMVVAVPLFTLFLLFTDKSKLKIKPKDCLLFVGTGIISVVLFNCAYFYTMIKSEASVAVVLLYTSPIFIMILSALFFKEKITFKKIVSLVLTFGGCILVAGIVGGVKIKPLIIITGLASGLFYGLYTIFGRLALKKYDTLTVTVYTFIFGLIGSLFVGKPVETAKAISLNPAIILWALGIGIICTVLPYFFYTWGLQRMDSGKAAITVAVEPLVGAVLGMCVYGESKSPIKILGILLILTAIVILNLPQKDKV